MSSPLAQLALALGLTVAIELAVVAAMGARSARELAAVALVNVVTNPVLNLGVLAFWAFVAAPSPVLSWTLVALAEVAVVIVEWRLLAWALRADSRTWLVRSLAMNVASFALGSWLLALATRALNLG